VPTIALNAIKYINGQAMEKNRSANKVIKNKKNLQKE
jgi:hypothetical protein